MKFFKMIIVFIAFLGLLNSAETWVPFNFKGTEHFKYEAKLMEDGKTITGFYVLDIEKLEGDKVKIHIKAKLGDNELETSFSGDKSNIYGSLMGQMMFNPALAPLLATLFAPYWGLYFMGQNWDVGSYWSFKTEEGKKITFKIESECEHAGIKGKKGVWQEEGKTRAEFCISTKVALPLRVYFKEEGGNTYEITLQEYRD